VLLGVLSGLWILRRGARRRDLDPDSLSDLTVVLVLFGIIGGRAWYLIQFREQVYASGDWFETFRLWRGGLVLYGAIGGGLLGFALMQRWRNYGPWRDLLDLIAPALAVGIAFGRLGFPQRLLLGCCLPRGLAAGGYFPPWQPPFPRPRRWQSAESDTASDTDLFLSDGGGPRHLAVARWIEAGGAAGAYLQRLSVPVCRRKGPHRDDSVRSRHGPGRMDGGPDSLYPGTATGGLVMALGPASEGRRPARRP
jgi:hypothetical protein